MSEGSDVFYFPLSMLTVVRLRNLKEKKNNLVFIEKTINEYDEQISQFRTQNC